GHAWQLWRDPSASSTPCGGREVVRVDLGTMPVYMVTTPQLIHEVTVRQGATSRRAASSTGSAPRR
ncbi:hypothetical protein LUX02_22915, partial [Streptomyces somaliensis]|nr:hypothetical protein [Streptomyces somaliensis]